jgi:hypothetical protein
MTMETLEFKDPDTLGIRKAQHFFDNNWGVSVLSVDETSKAEGSGVVYATSSPTSYEVAVIVGYNSNEWTLADYNDPQMFGNEWPVFSYLNEDEVNSLMEKVENLEPPF